MEFKKIPSNLQFKDHYNIFNKFNQLSKKDSLYPISVVIISINSKPVENPMKI
jgi:hypothetical protein